jgi:lysozyme family protein
MTRRFQRIIPFIFEWEGGYDNDPDDPGGETKFGIDKRSHPHEDIKNLTLADAKEIYFDEYWEPAKCESMSEGMGEVVFNCRVNCGQSRVDKILAIAKTAAAFLDAQEDFYHRLVAARPKSQKYLKGWLNRTRSLRKFLNL